MSHEKHLFSLQNFAADLTLQSARTRITVSLSGSGIQQTVDVVPFQTAYDMGAVLCPPQGKGTSLLVSSMLRKSTEAAREPPASLLHLLGTRVSWQKVHVKLN